MHVETYPAFFTPRDKQPSHSSFEETSSKFDLLEIKKTRKRNYEGKTEQVLCKIYFFFSSDYIYYKIFSITLVQRYIQRRYFLGNIPIISLIDYKEKIEIYTKYLEKKSNLVGSKYLRLHRWISHVELSIFQVRTLIFQVEFMISQLGGDSAT